VISGEHLLHELDMRAVVHRHKYGTG
jgi:hypothetical protein